jgi:predicted transcriptional regulator
MARPASEHPTELELQILQTLWKEAPLPVREIRQRLADEGRELAHTSVITILNIMVRKGYLKRTRQGNAFLFAPRVQQQGVSQRMVQSLIDRVFGGSTLAVVEHLLDTGDIDAAELARIRELINRKAKEPL